MVQTNNVHDVAVNVHVASIDNVAVESFEGI